MACRVVSRGTLLVATLFLLVLASQWAASHAGRPMGAPRTQSATEFGAKTRAPRLQKERKLSYDYTYSTGDSDASFDAESFSSSAPTGDEEYYIDSPETVQSVSSDPNADDVYIDTSSADTVYSAAQTDA